MSTEVKPYAWAVEWEESNGETDAALSFLREGALSVVPNLEKRGCRNGRIIPLYTAPQEAIAAAPVSTKLVSFIKYEAAILLEAMKEYVGEEACDHDVGVCYCREGEIMDRLSAFLGVTHE